jgi:stage II sporulation protein D
MQRDFQSGKNWIFQDLESDSVSVLLVSDGKKLNKSRKSEQTVPQFFRWTVFHIFIILIVLAGCSRQQRVVRDRDQYIDVPTIRVVLEDHLKSAILMFEDKFRFNSEEADYILDSSIGRFTIFASGTRLELKSEDRWFSFENFQEIKFSPVANGTFLWNGVPYSGSLIFAPDNESITAINSLPMPDYLKGVVPYEIPTFTEEYYQAVLSQTIAARTYAIYQMDHSQSSIFHIYGDTRDQVYQGRKRRSKLADKAVEESRGLILKDSEGSAVRTQYHSTCGGLLEISFDLEGRANPGLMKDYIQDAFNCVTSPMYRWVEKFTARNIVENLIQIGLLSEKRGMDKIENGFNLDIEVLSRDQSGRVDKIGINLDKEQIVLSPYQIRRTFRKDHSSLLPSNLFFLKDSPRDSTAIYLIGAGFGHGKGMCQWGAIGLALKKKNFQEILKFYYPDLKLEKIY